MTGPASRQITTVKVGSTPPAFRKEWLKRQGVWRRLAIWDYQAAKVFYRFNTIALFRFGVEAVAVMVLAVTVYGVYGEYRQRDTDRAVRIASLLTQIAEIHTFGDGGIWAIKASVVALARENVAMEGIVLRAADLRQVDLRGVNLQGADLRGVNLNGARLAGANLQHTDLRGAKLTDAKLRGADLRHARLYDADFTGADLRRADFRDVDFYVETGLELGVCQGSCRDMSCGGTFAGADLRNADLRGTTLANVKFRRADLRHTDLSGAFLLHTDFKGANLSYANLRQAHHDRTDYLFANLCGVDFEMSHGTQVRVKKTKLQCDGVPPYAHFP